MNAYQVIEVLSTYGLVFWIFPPVLWLLLRPWIRHIDRCRNDHAYARTRQAFRNFKRTSHPDGDEAWKTYLADRLNLHAEALTFETVECELQKHDIPSELMESVRTRFIQEDSTHYAPPGSDKINAATTRSLIRKIQKATVIILLAITLSPTHKTEAATGDQLFEGAMTIRINKPDEARPLFVQAALEFENEKQYLNAANSWFFAGRSGRALANYRSAETRDPFNKKVRDSITFIRTQRIDTFQTNISSLDDGPNAWTYLCRLSPSLRFGTLTLLYLLGWTLFIGARYRGKMVPQKVWMIYGATGLIVLFSLLWSLFQPATGVIIQTTEARLGPGYAYDPAYKTHLHEAVEFEWGREHGEWVQARLPSGDDAWLRKTACVKIK